MSPGVRARHHVSTRRVTVALGATCLLLAGLILPAGLTTTAQAGPSVQPRTTPPAATLAVIKVIGVGATPYSVAVDSVDDTVYVANAAGNSLSVIDGGTATVARTLAVGSDPLGVAVNQIDDTVYVISRDDITMSIINGRDLDDSRTIPAGVDPFRVAVDQNDDTVYITNANVNSVSVINGRDLANSGTIGVVPNPAGIAVNQIDDTVYVTNSVPFNSVSVINGRDLADSRTIPVGLGPSGIAVDQTDGTVYVANDGADTVWVIDGRTATVVGPPITVGSSPVGVAVDQTDDTVYVTNLGDNTVSVINGRTATVWTTLIVDTLPFGVAVDDTGTHQGLVYVTGVGDNTVSVIGRVAPSLGTRSGTAGSPVTINVNVPQVGYEVDDSTVTSVSFGGGAPIAPRALADDVWEVTAPAGTPGTTVAMPVTVTFRGELTASAGIFTLTTPAPPQPPVFPPSAPLNVTATAGDAQAQVTWAPPASSGSFPVTNYEIRSTPAGGTCLVSALTCPVTGLTNSTTYSFEARARNGAGWGPWSSPSNTVTPTPPPPPPPAVTISITGSRGTGADRQIVFVTGTSTGLDGEQVRVHVKLRGQANYRPGRFVDVSTEGRFDWQRTTGKKTYVYFTGGGLQSNRVIIPAAR